MNLKKELFFFIYFCLYRIINWSFKNLSPVRVVLCWVVLHVLGEISFNFKVY